MQKTTKIYIAITAVLILGAAVWLASSSSPFQGEAGRGKSPSPSTLTSSLRATLGRAAIPASEEPTQSLVEPVADFKQRITKKPFGIYATPQNSPVQPEHFTGYHTAVDVEYVDVTDDVPVMAIADGKVLLARWASGYGGVVAIQHIINGQPVIAIYGHLKPSSLPKVGDQVKAGQQIAILGKGGTTETDGERKHLHFGLVKGTTINLLGYVTTKEDLSKWIDPMTLF